MIRIIHASTIDGETKVVRLEFDGRTTSIANYHPDDFRSLVLLLTLGGRRADEEIEVP